jgi:gentisate 1,2-dioxygenase
MQTGPGGGTKSTSTAPGAAEADAFYRELTRQHLCALWNVNAALLPREPRSRAVPYLWRWDTLLPLCQRSGELATPQRGAERRVLGFINPGLPDRFGATHTLWAGFQYLLPGEVAPAHRHSPAAIRFVIQGDGAFTTVDGDKCRMSRGDLILTPPWTWHDHGHEGTEPMIWLDGLDLPLVAELEATFFEPSADDAQQVAKPVEDSHRRFGVGQLRPTWARAVGPHSPLLTYKWEETERALRRLATAAGPGGPRDAVGSADAVDPFDPFDDVAMEYINPHTGGSLMPTIACGAQLIRPGVRTRAHRHTGSAVYLAFEGRGYSVIDGQRFDWGPGDLFVVPSWAWHEHASESDAGAVLFSVQDTPVLRALGLWREQAYPDAGGHQPVTRVFGG